MKCEDGGKRQRKRLPAKTQRFTKTFARPESSFCPSAYRSS